MMYAVMDKSLKFISFEGSDIESCKRFCHNGDVIAERHNVKCGFSITFRWEAYNFGFSYDRFARRLTLGRLGIIMENEYRTATGKIVYYS